MGDQTPARAGFTLVEILLAVAILSIMVVLTTRIISNATDIIGASTRQSFQNTQARTVMDLITRDFVQAVGNSNYPFFWGAAPLAGVANALSGTTYGTNTHEGIKFVAFTGLPDANVREVDKICYFLREQTPAQLAARGFPFYRLMRSSSPVCTCCNRADWTINTIPDEDEVEVVPYVVSIRFDCRDRFGTPVSSGGYTNELPAYLDVYLTVLSEHDARRAYRLGQIFSPGSPQQMNYVISNARRYFTRCYSLNRTAYVGGR
jgi:prepilin-type N-terminal cleavage/methylation domain-containing protein